MIVTALILLIATAAVVRDAVSPVGAVLGSVVALLILGVVSPQEAFNGFANPAPATIAALYVVARAAEKTGVIQPLIRRTLGGGDGGRRSLARLLVPAAGASSVLNNTPIVAMLGPQIAEWAHRRGLPPSWYLMPLSFAAILGGTVTLIGTSTNIVVSGLLEGAGYAPLAVFEMTPVGLPLAVLGVLLLVLLAPLLLPDRRGTRGELTEHFREFVIQMQVVSEGALDGVTVEEGGLRQLHGVFLAEIERDGEMLTPARPDTRLRGGDRLIFVGRADDVMDLQTLPGLASAEEKHTIDFADPGHTFFEAVVSGTSALAGRTLKEIGFRGQYQAVVLAIHRSGERIREKLGGVRVRHGDTLLLLSDEGFQDRWRDRPDFLLVSHFGGSPPASSRMALYTIAVTLGMIALAALGLMPMLNAALLAATVLVLGGALSASDARRSIDIDVILLIAGAFGLGAAIENSGIAESIASVIIVVSESVGPAATLVTVAIVTMALTELITNNAAAALVFPIALSTATAAGLDPRPFAIAVALAASASFLTPIGYQTNTMVYGPGGYRFLDYIRMGIPLSILVLIVIGIGIPLVWGF